MDDRPPDEPSRDPTDWESGNPVGEIEGTGQDAGNALQFSWWNLFLLVPFVMLITAIYNRDEPRLFGMPMFYWYQLAFVFVGVASVGIVYAATKNRRPRPTAGDADRADKSGELR
jgi:hypothetical protein